MNSQLVSPEEARRILHCSLSRIYKLSAEGILTKYKLGSRLFFMASDLEAYIESCRVDSESK